MKRVHYNPLNLPKDVKWLAGAACFAEIARAAQSWDARELEDRRRSGAISIEKEDPDNGLHRLLRGELPSDTTIARWEAAFPGARLREWRDHGLWIALEENPTIPRLLTALKSLDAPAQKRIMAGASQPYEWDATRVKSLEEALIRELEFRADLGAFLALTVIARHAQASALARPHMLAAAATMRLFPTVVGLSPHLFASWPLLVTRFTENVWREPLRIERSAGPRTIVNQLIEVSDVARRTGIALPPANIIAWSVKRFAEECSIRSPMEAGLMVETTLPDAAA